MKIYFASDHAGYELKTSLIEYVKSLGYEVEDVGPYQYDVNDDYPITIEPLAKKLLREDNNVGIIIGGSGQGEAIVANRHIGIRATEYYGGNLDIVRLVRQHNDSNVLSLGARFVSESEAKEAVKLFLTTPFSNDERHIRRINEIDK